MGLLAVERVGGFGVVDLDAASALEVVVGVRVVPAAFARGDGEPEAVEVSARRRGCWVLVLRSSMQHMDVADELDVSHVEYHVQAEQLGRVLEHLHCLFLLLRQWRDVAGVDVALENWRMVAAAPGISDEQKAAIAADIDKLATSDAWKQELATRGWDDRYLAGPDFEKQLAADIESTKAILTEIGLVQ